MTRSSNLHPYPSEWQAPYAIKYRMQDCHAGAQAWLLTMGIALMFNMGYCAAYVLSALSAVEFFTFFAITSVGAASAGVKIWQLRVRAERLGQARAIYESLAHAPHAWREFALSRQAYAYAEHDDALRLCLFKLVFTLGGLCILGLGLSMVIGVKMPAAWWFAVLALALLGAVGLRRIVQRQRARQCLYHVLGPREMRAFSHLPHQGPKAA